MNCERDDIPMEMTLSRGVTPGTWRRKYECPVCHCRCFDLIADAAQKTDEIVIEDIPDIVRGFAANADLQCPRCKGITNKLFTLEGSKEYDFVCATCKLEIKEDQELEAQYRSNCAY